MVRNLRYCVRANGKTSEFFPGNGLAQGSVLAPMEFLVFADPLAWDLHSAGEIPLGISHDKGDIGAVLWSDDNYTAAEDRGGEGGDLSLQAALNITAEFSSSSRVRFHGHPLDKKGKEGKVLIFGQRDHGTRVFDMGCIKLLESRRVTFLGRNFSSRVQGTESDAADVIQRARKKIYLLKWAGVFSGSCNVDRMTLLAEALVHSLIRSHLSMIQLFKGGRRKAQSLQSRILKLFIGTGWDVSTKFLLAEFGHLSLVSTLEADKLVVHDSFKSNRARQAVRITAESRLGDVRQGDTLGITSEARVIWERWGRPQELSNLRNCGSATRKKWIRQLSKEEAIGSWKSWRLASALTHPLRHLCQQSWGKQRYLDMTDVPGRGLLMLFRAEAAALGVRRHPPQPCACGDTDDEVHVLRNCALLADARKRLRATVTTHMGPLVLRWAALPPLLGSAVLLGAPWELPTAMSDAISAATCRFLSSADLTRTSLLDLRPFGSSKHGDHLDPLDPEEIAETLAQFQDEIDDVLIHT
jgi:hypothetical protein